jgi:hypothetical protein
MREKAGFPPEMVDTIILILLAYLFVCIFILNIRNLGIFIFAGLLLIVLELYRFFLKHKINVPRSIQMKSR